MDSDEKKLFDIENEFYEFNKNNKSEALELLLKNLEQVDSEDFSKIDRNVTEGEVKNFDVAVYFATTLAIKSSDFQIRSLNTLNSSFNKAPFYTQETAAKIIKASIISPDLFSQIIESKRNPEKSKTVDSLIS